MDASPVENTCHLPAKKREAKTNRMSYFSITVEREDDGSARRGIRRGGEFRILLSTSHVMARLDGSDAQRFDIVGIHDLSGNFGMKNNGDSGFGRFLAMLLREGSDVMCYDYRSYSLSFFPHKAGRLLVPDLRVQLFVPELNCLYIAPFCVGGDEGTENARALVLPVRILHITICILYRYSSKRRVLLSCAGAAL